MSAKDFGAWFEIEDFVEDLHDDGYVVSERADGLPEVSGPHALDAERAQFLNDNRAQIARYLACERARARFAKPIEAKGPQDQVPLTAQQHAMWLSLSLADGAAPTYHTPTVLRLTGALDVPRLSQALAMLFARHDALRTVIVEADGVPFQRVTEPVPVRLTVHEVPLADLGEAVRAAAMKPFDLSNGPLVRATLFKHGAGDHTLLLLHHHLVSDGWTIALLARDLGAFYSGGAEALARPKLQYADYALWQHEALAGNAAAPLAQHWAETLAGWSPLELASDQPLAACSDEGAHHHFHIPKTVVAALEQVARDHRTTLFSVVAAAFIGLLKIHARQDDVTILTAVAGRQKRELADLAGYFVNLLPLRAQCGSSAPFSALVDQVSEALVEAQSHADVPYADIVKAAAVARDVSGRTALERAVLVFQSASAGPPPRFEGLDVTVDPEADLPIAKFELTFSLSPTENGLDGRAEYATDRYDSATMTMLCQHFVQLLSTFAGDPQTPVTGSALLDTATFEAVVTAPNCTATPYPRDATLTDLFAEVAEAQGDAVAVRDGSAVLTYRDLDAWSDAVAMTLLGCGATAGEEPMVALRMGRGAPLLAAILGVLKAGAAYVPIDPLYPQNRASMMIEATDACALIAPKRTADDEAIARDGCTLIGMDAIAGNGPVSAPPRTPTDLAYVCFTSGTTGAPKGVLVPHRAVVRLVRNSNVIAPKVGERIGLASNAVFDAVTLEIWGALLNGATLVVVDQDTLLDPDRLASFLAEHRVDHLWLTAALFDQMAGHRPEMFGRLKTLFAGGSALNPDMVRRVLTCPTGAPARFVNGYGPTENTTFSTIHPVASVPENARTIPIGRPISNALAFVLDETGQPVPPGIVGELHVGGDGLARGYLNDPERTAQKFAHHTFTDPTTGASTSHRLYATGDLVRWRDGVLDFVGRNDRQVKLHGFRVEPGEVEFAMGQCPGVLQAVAQVLAGEDGHPRLLAWFTSAPDTPVAADELRQHLKRVLPPYMVPGALMPLERMPVNTSGKVDLGALPLPDFGGEKTEAADGVEEALLGIWRAVLRSDAIGVDDDFFSMGGDSILTIQVVARAREIGLRLAPRDIFEVRTVAGLAARASREAAPDAPTAPIGPPGLTPIQRWFFALDLAAPEHFNQAFLLLPPHDVSFDALAGAAEELVARHDALRQRFTVSANGDHQVRFVPPGIPD
ncbi:MAG: amino acid adenylation domain-containing protein, partial [Pseudomonadota bacterium]